MNSFRLFIFVISNRVEFEIRRFRTSHFAISLNIANFVHTYDKLRIVMLIVIFASYCLINFDVTQVYLRKE